MAALSHRIQAAYDAIVIGAGIQGSFTAYHLAQRRRNTLLLEQVLESLVLIPPALLCPCPDAPGEAFADLWTLCRCMQRSRSH